MATPTRRPRRRSRELHRLLAEARRIRIAQYQRETECPSTPGSPHRWALSLDPGYETTYVAVFVCANGCGTASNIETEGLLAPDTVRPVVE